jgi:hypothetical protein
MTIECNGDLKTLIRSQKGSHISLMQHMNTQPYQIGTSSSNAESFPFTGFVDFSHKRADRFVDQIQPGLLFRF